MVSKMLTATNINTNVNTVRMLTAQFKNADGDPIIIMRSIPKATMLKNMHNMRLFDLLASIKLFPFAVWQSPTSINSSRGRVG